MYNHLIVAVSLDHAHEREDSRELAIARTLCAKGGRITALHVTEELPAYATQFLPPNHQDAHLAEMRQALHHLMRDASDVTPVVVSGHAGRTIVEFADEHGADCIVLSSHRPGLEDYFLGSTASRVVRHANCSVHVIR